MDKKRRVDSTWLVVREIEGTITFAVAQSKEEAQAVSEELLQPRPAARKGQAELPSAGAGVVELDHTLRAARVIAFRRAGQAPPPRLRDKTGDDQEDKTPPSPAAYDVFIPFGYDIERELAAGRQPPPERVTAFVQKLGIPIVISKKTPVPVAQVKKGERRRRTMIALAVFVLLLIATLVVVIFSRL